MGYCIEMTESSFVIKRADFQNALNALKAVFVPENMTTYDCINGKKFSHFRWVKTKTVLESTDLEGALKEIRYAPQYDKNGDICGVEFTGEKYGDEKIFFEALAPYVKDGSYLCFKGEDGRTWKWLFADNTVNRTGE